MKKIEIDRDWLCKAYLEQGLSMNQIAKNLEISLTTVTERVKEHGIKKRTQAEATSLAQLKSNDVFEKLKDKAWLISQYEDCLLSISQIASDLGVASSVVLRHMRTHGISVRSLSQSSALRQKKHVLLTTNAINFLDGEILGDGHIAASNFSAKYSHSSKHRAYLEWLKSVFFEFGIEQAGRMVFSKKDKGYRYHSLSYVELKEMHKRWYGSGEKRLPEDFRLTPVTLRQWYIGDGHLSRERKTPAVYLAVCTRNSMEIERIIDMLLAAGIRGSAGTTRTKCIRITSADTQNFFDYIGECPAAITQIYGYKWP